jgi:uncharacterized RDD family membrane protein YckC
MPELKYATFTGRMLASVIDTLLSTIVLLPVFNFVNSIFKWQQANPELAGRTEPMNLEEALTIIQASLPSFLFQTSVIAVVVVMFWVYRSATPGKMLLKMKIVDAKTGERPRKKQLIIRYLGYFISVIPFGLGFIWIYYDKKKQGFHDKLAGTVVVKE